MNKPRALIIEDDEDLAIIFAEALQMAEFETEIAKDGQTALDKLAATQPIVIVLDLHLPYVSGEEILRRIRDDERLANVRIMIATADPLIAENLRNDVDLVLLKPISFNQIRDLAARLRPPDITNLEP